MLLEKILVIEDDPDVRDTVCSALEALLPRAKVTALTSGDEFLRVFQEGSDWQWDLVVLDLMLPGLSGVDICRLIRGCDTGHDVPILAMTGYDTSEMEKKIKEAGATCYLAKPFEITDFKSVIQGMLNGIMK